MSVQGGDVLGHYRIVEPLGSGGMGEVFVAEDTRLHRRVALKILPALLASDPSHRERFEREARSVAALTHPNIVTLHSVEEHEGRLFLTMELVDGKPLSELIPRGGLPLDRLLRIGIEVADAMSAAQHQGITHRDLKPANVVIAANGRAKVLDFGLAKAKDAELAAAGDALTRMVTGRDLTGEGRIIGTAAYMSPEQAEGKAVDPRSDIFSFGVMLHEMATGSRPFKGDTNVSIISSIIKDTPPPVTDANPALPADLARIVRRCLAKDPERRYQTATDLRNELEELKQDTDSGTAAMPRPQPRRTLPAVAIAGGLVVVLAAFAGWFTWGRREATPAAGPAVTFSVDRLSRLTTTGSASLAAISADGRYVVHVKGEAGGKSLWIRQTATASDVRIVPPADVRFDGLAFGPDGNYVYYSAYPATGASSLASLYRIPALGGSPVKLIEDIDSSVAFAPDGQRLAFLRHSPTLGTTALMVADLNGGNVRPLAQATAPDRFRSDGLAWSPDGATILTVASSSRPGVIAIVYAVDVRTGAAKPTGEPWAVLRDVQWLPDGRSYLLNAIDMSGHTTPQIWQVTFPRGERSRVTNDLNAYQSVSLSADGESLAVVQGEVTASIYLANGAEKEPRRVSGGARRQDGDWGLAWLPDGRLVYSSTASDMPQLWISDADGGNARQLTSLKGPAGMPSSAPDGRQIYFHGFDEQGIAMFRVAPDGSGLERMTIGVERPVVAPDGTTVYYTSTTSGSPRPMKLSLSGGAGVQLSQSLFRVFSVSPDGARLLGSTFSPDERRFVLATLTVATGAIEPVPETPTPAVFMPDGGLAVAQRAQGASTIAVRPPRGGPLQAVTPPSTETIYAIAVSRERRIAFSRGTQTTDVVLIKAK